MTSFGREVKPWVRVVDLRHVKEPQAEIRASEKNLSDFSRSLLKATLMTWDVKNVVKPKSTTAAAAINTTTITTTTTPLQIKLGEYCNACSSALCNFLHSPVI